MNRCCSFPPSAGPHAEVLILGSMPGGESLRQQQYYAFPRNAFWKIMGILFSIPEGTPYAERLKHLNKAGVALWDVLKACEREGSLDSSIIKPVPNEIPGFLTGHPEIKTIFCNGSAAFQYFKKYFPELLKQYTVIQLPSTSPAAAMYSFGQKYEIWEPALKKSLTSSDFFTVSKLAES